MKKVCLILFIFFSGLGSAEKITLTIDAFDEESRRISDAYLLIRTEDGDYFSNRTIKSFPAQVKIELGRISEITVTIIKSGYREASWNTTNERDGSHTFYLEPLAEAVEGEVSEEETVEEEKAEQTEMPYFYILLGIGAAGILAFTFVVRKLRRRPPPTPQVPEEEKIIIEDIEEDVIVFDEE